MIRSLALLAGIFGVCAAAATQKVPVAAASFLHEQVDVHVRPADIEFRGQKSADGSTYTNADIRFGKLRIEAERVVVQRSEDCVQLIGSGKVRVSGVPEHTGPILADQFTWSSATGAFNFAGSVHLPHRTGLVKAIACGVGRDGSHRDLRTLLLDFEKAVEPIRSQLVPRLLTVYEPSELPEAVRLRAAIELLRTHMTWHAPIYQPGELEKDYRRTWPEEARQKRDEVSNWAESLSMPEWLQHDIPDRVREPFEREVLARERLVDRYLETLIERRNNTPEVNKFLDAEWTRRRDSRASDLKQAMSRIDWRLKDPQHADVQKALVLLKNAQSAEARRWKMEIERNNTIVTLDVTGAYEAKKDAPVVLDVRNADKLTFKLFRVKSATDLLWVTDRIGTDFVYHDYGLQTADSRDKLKVLAEMKMDVARRFQREELARSGASQPRPEFLNAKPIALWDQNVANLEKITQRLRYRDRYVDRDKLEDPDHELFDDASERHRERIEKSYRPKTDALTSWRCDRRTTIPGQYLAEPGAYVLAVEANGQTTYAPIVVDPLTMALRRCRDGVMVVVSDASGTKPVAGAEVFAKPRIETEEAQARRLQSKPVKTDGSGVAWASVFAAGDRAIIAHHEGRFAIGGFGQLFQGIYTSDLDREHDIFYGWHRFQDSRKLTTSEPEALIYADRSVVAAYTDRPIYRPGQTVQFKAIVRQLAKAKEDAKDAANTVFRADLFDTTPQLTTYPTGTDVTYTVHAEDGKVVGSGRFKLNDFGTASGQLTLPIEASQGVYDLRLTIANNTRLVRGLFAVRQYRLPNFQVEANVPARIPVATDLKLKIVGKYLVGKPVADGRVEVRVMAKSRRNAVFYRDATLNQLGEATMELPLGQAEAGEYEITLGLRDLSGRTESKTYPIVVGELPKPAAKLLDVPQYHPLAKALVIPTKAQHLTAKQWRTDGKMAAPMLTAKSVEGRATFKFTQPGWYEINDGKNTTEVFVYGGTGSPFATTSEDPSTAFQNPVKDDLRLGYWVNLSNYEAEKEQSRDERSPTLSPVYALFDRRTAEVGGKLSFLIYVPSRSARVLITYEGRTVVDYQTATMPKDSHYLVVDLPIRGRHLPNFFVQAKVLAQTEFRPDDSLYKLIAREALKEAEIESEGDDPRWCRIDVTDPKQVAASEKLMVTLSTDREVYKPGEEVDVSLVVSDRQGTPVDAEVSLAVVDEAIYTFGNDRVSRLAEAFSRPYAERFFLDKAWRASVPLALRQKQLRYSAKLDKAVKAMEAAKALQMAQQAQGVNQQLEPTVGMSPTPEEMPIGTIPLSRLRSDFRETAAWLPHLRTDDDGIVDAKFRLPDGLTTYRLTAAAVTKETAVGTAVSRVRTLLPLTAQVILPRFGVENDHIEFVGMIQNHEDKERTVSYRWTVEGAKTDGATVNAAVVIAARKNFRVALPVLLDRIGPVRVTLHVDGGKNTTDAETRTMIVEPAGRAMRYHADGIFNKTTNVKLPANFVPTDVNVVVSVSHVASALEGLDGLIDYPYGCVEQTMSRFMPAVVVQRALKDSSIILSPTVAAKLPDVLKRGLQRLVMFQHSDGGWGWWEKDNTDYRMTIYVIHGLVQCRDAGVAVDAEVLKRGVAFLSEELKANRVPKELIPRAMQALAQHGDIDLVQLRHAAELALNDLKNMESICRLALALKTAGAKGVGDHDKAIAMWKKCAEWKPTTTESLALQLIARLTFGDDIEATRSVAANLIKLRQGLGWENTIATATAITALARMLPHEPKAIKIPREIRLSIEGKLQGVIQPIADSKELIYRFAISGSKVDQELKIEVIGESGPVIYTVVSEGVERLADAKGIGREIRVGRQFETVDGKPFTGSLKVGQVIQVRLKVELQADQEYVLVEDRRPSVCEFADDRIDQHEKAAVPTHLEFRDDRVCMFFGRLPAGTHEFVYYLRGETVGTGTQLPGKAYPMYRDTIVGETGGDTLRVVAAER